MLEGCIALLVLLVEEYGVALGEGSALAVLAGEADRETFLHERAESELLGHGPVDALSGLDHLAAAFDEALERFVQVEIGGNGREPAADLLQSLLGYAGIAAPVAFLGGPVAGPFAVEPIGLVGLVAVGDGKLALEMMQDLALHVLHLGVGDDALADELLGIDLGHRRMLADDLVHLRLREARLVALVVTVAAIAEHVDDDRLAEFLPELGGDLGDIGDGLGIIAVHVEDRRLHHARDVRRVRRGAGEARRRRETDLIVDDEVDRAADAMAFEARQAETFGHDALAGEGGIAMQEERQDVATGRPASALILLGAHLAEHDGIDDFQMRGVRGQRQMHALAAERAVGGGAQMVLHVARALDLVGLRRTALELVENGAVRLRHDAREYIQPAAMRHADDDLFDAEIAAALDDLLERRDHRLAAFEAETLRAGVLDLQEFLEALRLDELVENRLFAERRELDPLLAAFDAALNPAALIDVGDVHILDADLGAVGLPHDVDDLAHGEHGMLGAERVVEIDGTVEIGLQEAVSRRQELGMILPLGQAQRIEVGGQMPAHAIGADERQGGNRVVGGAERGGGRQLGALGLCLLADRGLDDAVRGYRSSLRLIAEAVAVGRRPVWPDPRRASRLLGDAGRVVAQALEESPPVSRDARGIAGIALVHFGEVGGVGAFEKGGFDEGLIPGLSCHLDPHLRRAARKWPSGARMTASRLHAVPGRTAQSFAGVRAGWPAFVRQPTTSPASCRGRRGCRRP